MQVGTKIYTTSADTLSTIAQTQVYQEISEKSKVALGHVSEKISETSKVREIICIYNVIDCDDQNCWGS